MMEDVDTLTVPLERLDLNEGQLEGVPSNPRRISPDKLAALVRSLREDPGMLRLRELVAVPLGDRLVVVGGNARLLALREMGAQEAPVKVLPADTPAAFVRAFTVKDNNAYGEWDWELLRGQWDLDELERWDVELPDAEPVPEEVEQDVGSEDGQTEELGECAPTRVKPGELWRMGDHLLLCGDSCDAASYERLLAPDGDTAPRLLLTDPPYGVDYGSKQRDMEEAVGGVRNTDDIAGDRLDERGLTDLLRRSLGCSYRRLGPGAAIYVWMSDRRFAALEGVLAKMGAEPLSVIVWVKNNFVLGRGNYQQRHELCRYAWKPGGERYFIRLRSETTTWEDMAPAVAKMPKGELVNLVKRLMESGTQSDVWYCDKPMGSREHPTMKPVRLFGRAVRNSSRRGELVLDPFAGSGTTAICCEQLGRRARLIEISPKYCDVILDRWERLTKGRAERVD